MSSKYKVGDKVKIRDDLQNGVRYGHDTFEGDDGFDMNMAAYLGKIVTIKEVISRESESGKYYYYRIEEDCEGWNWTDQMIEHNVTPCKFMTNS